MSDSGDGGGKLIIPRENEDLRRFVRGKFCKSLFLTLGWELGLALVFCYYYAKGRIHFNLRFFVMSGIFVLLGLLLFGLPKWILTGSYTGEIIGIKYREVFIMNSVLGRGGVKTVTMMRMRVRDDRGHRHTVEIPFKTIYKRYYHVGDRIRRYKGLAFPESGDGADKGIYLCCKCGGMEMTERETCMGCGATLIKPDRNKFIDPFFDGFTQ